MSLFVAYYNYLLRILRESDSPFVHELVNGLLYPILWRYSPLWTLAPGLLHLAHLVVFTHTSCPHPHNLPNSF